MKDLRLDEQGLRILTAEITNFKNISYKEVEFNGKSAIIAGKNGAGKSAFLSALMSPIDSRVIPPKPIKDGEEKAEIEIEVGGILHGQSVKYKLAIYFSQANQKGRIVVYDEDGAKVEGGKTIIDSLVGNIGFDIFEFINKGKTPSGKPSEAGLREQIEILTSLMPQEGVEKLHNLDAEYNQKYAERTEINSECKRLEALLKHNFTQEEIELYEKPKDDTEVKEKMVKVVDFAEKWSTNMRKIESNNEALSYLPNEIAELEAKLAAKKKELADAQEFKVKAEQWLAKNPEKPSVESISKELQSIQSHNEKHLEVKRLFDNQQKAMQENERSEKITERLSAIKNEKKQVFASYPLPVKDLEFDESSITYQGLPLHDEQINTSKLIAIGLRIGMAMNPNLRVMIIRDGSLLDKETIAYVLKIADKYGYQLFIEMVDSDKGEVDVEFIERDVV
jgi:predicted ATP-dependent endonuclease of OLD family